MAKTEGGWLVWYYLGLGFVAGLLTRPTLYFLLSYFGDKVVSRLADTVERRQMHIRGEHR